MRIQNGMPGVYAPLGLWLLVSPFLLFGGQASLMNTRIVETVVLMLSGLAALWVACLTRPKEHLLRSLAGLILGVSMILAPEVISLDQSAVTVWSVRVFGSVFVLCALVELFAGRTARRLP